MRNRLLMMTLWERAVKHLKRWSNQDFGLLKLCRAYFRTRGKLFIMSCLYGHFYDYILVIDKKWSNLVNRIGFIFQQDNARSYMPTATHQELGCYESLLKLSDYHRNLALPNVYFDTKSTTEVFCK